MMVHFQEFNNDDLTKYTCISLHHMQMMFLTAIGFILTHQSNTQASTNSNQIKRTIRLHSERVRDEVMKRVGGPSGRYLIRMSPSTFIELCSVLVKDGGLRATQRATVEEQVAKFLWIIGQNTRHSACSVFFRRSGETVSRHFHKVIEAIIELEDKFIVQPNGDQVPSEIIHHSRFYPFFKDCVGAIDGTHICVKVPVANAARYRGRKEYPTMNVLTACTFDLKFTYVLTGWEGTASDSRIMKNALTRDDPLHIPRGKFYLVDAGFMLRSGLITPYRGERYHIKEYSQQNPPKNARELFNHQHSSLRNVIERSFGVLKKRFPIIASGTEAVYKFKTQKLIVSACCIIHNFLMGIDPDESLINEVDAEMSREPIRYVNNGCNSDSNEDAKQGEFIRNAIANAMWDAYVQTRVE